MKTNRGFGKIFLILILAGLAFYFFVYKKDGTPITFPDGINTEGLVGKNCYEYDQVATTEAPYTVHEKIELVVLGNKVAMGLKKGTQSGPDMTNGYEGTLAGTIDGDTLNVDYSYKIEGSEQKEKEIYKVKSDALIKQRYVLKEVDGVLVPDLENFVSEIIYKKVDCVLTEEIKNWVTADTVEGISFLYPKALGTNYLQLLDWPPQLNLLDEEQGCLPAGSEIDRAGKTEMLNVNGNNYCVTTKVEGAAGSIYSQYAYAFVKNGMTYILNFSTKAVQCGNYDEPKKSECEAERENFDLSSIVDKIFRTMN